MTKSRPAPLRVDYWRLTNAIAQAFYGHQDEPFYWSLIVKLEQEFPEFDWHNAISDHYPKGQK